MKVYPKVPRYDHPVVPDELYKSDSLDILEKMDGSSFRFTLYDSRFSGVYSDRVERVADRLDEPSGTIIFGTRKSVIGGHTEPLSNIDGALHRAVRCLRNSIDIDSLYSIHDEYGPVTIYAENMVFTNIEYGYNDIDIPALVGFDVALNEAVETFVHNGNPYEEMFDIFLETDQMLSLFDDIDDGDDVKYSISPPMIVERNVSIDDFENYEIPKSKFNPSVLAEGVVIRDDETNRRVKIVRDDMSEINRQIFGQSLDDSSNGTEYIIEKYGTQRRIRKEIFKMIIEDGYEFGPHMNDDLHRRVVSDIWHENLDEIMKLDREIVPGDVYPKIAERCINVIRRIETNAELNETEPQNIWDHVINFDEPENGESE